LQVNPLIVFTFIYSCCFIKKIATFFFKKPFFVLFFFFVCVCVCVCLCLLCLFAFCTVTVNPGVPRAGEAGTPPPRGHCGGVARHRLLPSLGTLLSPTEPWGASGSPRIPGEWSGSPRIPGNGAGRG